MGSAVSRGTNLATDSTDKVQPHGKTFCCSCGNESAAQPRDEVNAGSSGAQVLNVEKEHTDQASTSQSKKFFYYPKKESPEDETLYVTTSQFPYNKPKAVVVRQHVVKDGVRVEEPMFANNTTDITYQTSVHPKLNAALQEHLGVNDGKRPYHTVNDRRWSSPNVVPSSGFMPEKVLPHRTVAELRRNSLNFPSYDHYERFYGYNYHFGGSGHRPPTPSPSAWYPAKRTNDYLVASSLLAMERQRDRIQAEKNAAENKDIHSF